MSQKILMPSVVSNIFFRWQLKSVRRRYLMLYPQLFWPWLAAVSPFAIIGVGTVIIGAHDFYWENWIGGGMALGWALLSGAPFWTALVFWCRFCCFDFKRQCFFCGSFRRNKIPFDQIAAIELARINSTPDAVYYSFNLILTNRQVVVLFTQKEHVSLNEYARIIAEALEIPVRTEKCITLFSTESAV